MAAAGFRPYISQMSTTNPTHPYTVEVFPTQKPAGHFSWAIRRHGKLIERSDRPIPSERSAQEKAQAALERQFHGER